MKDAIAPCFYREKRQVSCLRRSDDASPFRPTTVLTMVRVLRMVEIVHQGYGASASLLLGSS
jgi:hypothetical protein